MPRLLHTADWRLGHLPPELISAQTAGPVDLATRFAAVERLAALAHEERVDVVVVAGNAMDDHDVDEVTLVAARRALAMFAPIPVLLVPGDRDSAEPEGVLDRLGPISHVHVARERCAIELGGVCLIACPRSRRNSDEDPLLGLTLPPSALPRVVVAHGLAPGMRGETTDRLIAERAAGADWLALGGTHATSRRGLRAAWSGTPEPWSFEPAGHALLVELGTPGEEPRVDERSVAITTWLRISQETRGRDDLLALQASLDLKPRPLIAELQLTGTLPVGSYKYVGFGGTGVNLRLEDQVRLDFAHAAAPAGLMARAVQILLERGDQVGERAAARLLGWTGGD